MSTTSYWLEEPAEPRGRRLASRARRRRDRRRWDHRAARARSRSPRRGCACGSSRRARSPAERADATAGSRSAAAPLRTPCSPSRSGPRRRPSSGGGRKSELEQLAGARGRRVPSDRAASGSPPTTRSATSYARSTRRCATRASPPSGARTSPRRSTATRRHCSIRPTACCSPRGSCARIAERAAAAGVEIHEHTRVVSLDETGADTVVVATDGYPSGLLGELEGLIVPTRGQVIATEPIEELLFEIPHYGRHGFDYWHQRLDGRIVAGGFRDVSLDTEFTAEEVTTPVVQGALERFVEEHVGRPLRVDYRWAGIFGMVFDFLPGRRARPGHGRALDRRRLLGSRQRARLRLRPPRRARHPRRERPEARALRARRGSSCD